MLHLGAKLGGRRLETRTDPAGHYSFENVDPGPCTLLVVSHSGDGPTRREYHRTLAVLDGTTQAIDVEFRSGSAVLKGRITVGGKLASKATVGLLLERSGGSELRSAEATADGLYHFDEVPEGSVSLVIKAEEEKYTRRVDLQIEKGQSLEYDVDIAVGGTVSGEVAGLRADELAAVFAFPGDVDVRKGMPVAELQAVFRRMVARVVVQTDGPYELCCLTSGQHSIIAFASPRNPTDPDNALADSRIVKKLVDVKEPGSTVDIVFD